jgi:hypothetical protein
MLTAATEPITVSPIAHVTEDVLRAIFTTVVDMVNVAWNTDHLWDPHRFSIKMGLPYYGMYRSSAHAPLALSHVCASWRALVFSDCGLWCAVDLAQPRLAELCMELSRPRNIHVHLRCLQSDERDMKPEPSHNYKEVLNSVFQNATRIESLVLTDYVSVYTPYFKQCILPILTEHKPEFPSLKTLRGTTTGSRDLNYDCLVNGASGSLQNFELPSGRISFDLLCSFHLVELKLGKAAQLTSLKRWRKLLSHLAHSLKHLDFTRDLGLVAKDVQPPVILPHLHTLWMQGARLLASMSLKAPAASHITIEDSTMNADDDDAASQDYAKEINERCRESINSSTPPPYHLGYILPGQIIISSPEILHGIVAPRALSALRSLVRQLDTRLCQLVTRLVLEGAVLPFRERRRGGHGDPTADFAVLAERLPNIREVWLFQRETEKDFLSWLAHPDSLAVFPELDTLSFVGYDLKNKDNLALLVKVLESRSQSGRPIRLKLQCQGPDDRQELAMMRGKGWSVEEAIWERGHGLIGPTAWGS